MCDDGVSVARRGDLGLDSVAIETEDRLDCVDSVCRLLLSVLFVMLLLLLLLGVVEILLLFILRTVVIFRVVLFLWVCLV